KAEPQPKGPLGVIKKWLSGKLPQADDVWQAEVRQMPTWIRVAGAPVRPWIVLVTSRSHDLILAHEIAEAEPTPARVWDTLVQAMQHPMVGEPHRPTELQVLSAGRWEELRPHPEEVGVRLAVAEALDQAESLLRGLGERLGGGRATGLLDVPGVTPQQVGSFYQAAAAFFRQAPWKRVGYESAIRV